MNHTKENRIAHWSAIGTRKGMKQGFLGSLIFYLLLVNLVFGPAAILYGLFYGGALAIGIATVFGGITGALIGAALSFPTIGRNIFLRILVGICITLLVLLTLNYGLWRLFFAEDPTNTAHVLYPLYVVIPSVVFFCAAVILSYRLPSIVRAAEQAPITPQAKPLESDLRLEETREGDKIV